MTSEVSWFWFQSQFKKDYRKTIESISDNELSELNKMLLRKRFIPILKTMELEMKRVSTGFTLFQIVTTLGSIVVPALLSIEDRNFSFNTTNLDLERQSHNLYWTTWAISIAVTISNAFNQLLGLEKKYIIRNIHLSQMKKEGWSFLEKSGNVYGKDPSKTRNELIYIFWKRVETLRPNQVKNDLSFDNTDDLINNNPEMIETLNNNDEYVNIDSDSIPEPQEETMI
jgi:hypothetical protein